MKLTTIEIKVAINLKPTVVEVEAAVFGVWAAHKAWNDKGWSITHVPTGLCVPPFYTEDLSRFRVIEAAKALHMKFGRAKPNKKNAEAITKEIWRVGLGGRAPAGKTLKGLVSI